MACGMGAISAACLMMPIISISISISIRDLQNQEDLNQCKHTLKSYVIMSRNNTVTVFFFSERDVKLASKDALDNNTEVILEPE